MKYSDEILDTYKEREMEFAEKEHGAGFHQGHSYLHKKVCYECYKDYQSFLRLGELAMERRGGQ